MKILKGIPVSSGIVIGKAHIYLEDSFTIPKYDIQDYDFELYRLSKAVEKTKEEIKNIQKSLNGEIDKEKNELFNAFLLFLEDESLFESIKEELHTSKKNIEWVLYIVLKEIVEKFKKLDNDYFMQRSEDIHAVGKHLMRNLLKKDHPTLDSLNEKVILVTRNLALTDAALLKRNLIIGLVTEIGGEASHTAIMARALGLPSVLGIEFVTSEIEEGETIIVNGYTGEVIVDPDKNTLLEAEEEIKKHKKFEKEILKYKDIEPITKDGVKLNVYANIEIMDELELVKKHGGDGIGLFRSEFLVLETNSFPPESYQYKIYKEIFDFFDKNEEIIIRTLDLGGDKIIPGYSFPYEKNPFLGWRAIRFCLSKKQIFKSQLRAILRASYGVKNVGIMIPMIATLEEILETKKILKECENELETEGIPYNKNYKFGIMIEIPAAVLNSEEFAKHVDFFSIGTNDLIQYLLAVDRGNEQVAYLFKYSNPTVLKALEIVINNANKKGIEVAMCGEMASDVYSIPLLIGMGLRKFSVSPKYITELKKIITSVTYKECKQLYDKVKVMCKIEMVEKETHEWMKKRFPDIEYF